jgi:hypothetical protein
MSSLSMNIPRGRPIQLRVHVQDRRRRRSKLFYRFFIFRDVDEMRMFALMQSRSMYSGRVVDGVRIRTDFGAASRRESFWRHCYGAARWFGDKSIPKKPNQVGVVLLARGYLSQEIVAHEIAHAAVYHVVGSGRPAKFKAQHDEALASLVGSMSSQFESLYWKAYRAHARKRRRTKR